MSTEKQKTTTEPELSKQKSDPFTKEQKVHLSRIDPSKALSPYEDPREASKHFPAQG